MIVPHVAGFLMGGDQAPLTEIVTLDPVNSGAGIALSNGNLDATSAGGTWYSSRATSSKTGKRYVEGYVVAASPGAAYTGLALVNASANVGTYFGIDGNGILWYTDNGGDVRYAGTVVTTVYGTVAGAYMGWAFDTAAGKCWPRLNGTFAGDPVAGTGGLTLPSGAIFAGTSALGGGKLRMNFGATAFQSAPPAGFLPYNQV